MKANAVAPVAATRMTEGLFDGLMDAMDPALVSPLVAYLSSSACDVSGGSLCRRRRHLLLSSASPLAISNPNLTAEDIAANWDTIRNEDGYIVPDDNNGNSQDPPHS